MIGGQHPGVPQLPPANGRAQLVERASRDGRPPLSQLAPTREQLGYAKELMIVVLMVVAFPWLLRKAFSNPGAITSAAAPAAMK